MTLPLIHIDTLFSHVILANGSFPRHAIPLSILQHAGRLICCDGAYGQLVSHHMATNNNLTVIGDGDSLPDEIKAQIDFVKVDEQDYNDLTKATRYLVQHSKDNTPLTVAYIGAAGRREDHELANIALMAFYYRELHINPVLITDYGWFTVASGECELETFPRQQVSIFNFGCSKLQSNGLKWQSYAYRELWQGTLNEATGHKVSLNGDGVYMVYRTYEAKL